MRADSLELAIRAAEWVGRKLSAQDRGRLIVLHNWLATEAIKAGGLGPHERERLWGRHVADSILFGVAFDGDGECLDIGSGVGLPGIPLALVYSEIRFTLLDRSGRRCDLMRRAVAVLGLENCEVVHQDIVNVDEKFRWVVSRAAIPPTTIMIHVKHLLKPGGIAILGLSRSDNSRNPLGGERGIDSTVVTVPTDILDTDVNLLRIEPT